VDRGRLGRGLVGEAPWKEDLRLTSGEGGAEEAGDRNAGGVYGISTVRGGPGEVGEVGGEPTGW
jgi:hypothetical protein